MTLKLVCLTGSKTDFFCEAVGSWRFYSLGKVPKKMEKFLTFAIKGVVSPAKSFFWHVSFGSKTLFKPLLMYICYLIKGHKIDRCRVAWYLWHTFFNKSWQDTVGSGCFSGFSIVWHLNLLVIRGLQKLVNPCLCPNKAHKRFRLSNCDYQPTKRLWNCPELWSHMNDPLSKHLECISEMEAITNEWNIANVFELKQSFPKPPRW